VYVYETALRSLHIEDGTPVVRLYKPSATTLVVNDDAPVTHMNVTRGVYVNVVGRGTFRVSDCDHKSQ
jgi:hypothetical protein